MTGDREQRGQDRDRQNEIEKPHSPHPLAPSDSGVAALHTSLSAAGEGSSGPESAETAAARGYPLRVATWRTIPGLVHGFLGREHALPPGSFTLVDLRARLVDAGEVPDVVLAARQTHGTGVLLADRPAALAAAYEGRALPAALPEADALVTAGDAILTIRTADCVPILLVCPEAGLVAAVHAGWRGLLAGVIESTLTVFRHGGAAPLRVFAAVGPAIGPCCYEFGAEHLPAFRKRLGTAVDAAWRAPISGGRGADSVDQTRGYLDLRHLARIALERAGVPAKAVATIGPCTADSPGELHSYRRDGAHAGRQLSYIGWRR